MTTALFPSVQRIRPEDTHPTPVGILSQNGLATGVV